MSRPVILLALLAAAALGACDRGPCLTDPAQTIRVKVGEEFQVSLEDTPGMRYRWHLVDSAARAPLVLVDSARWSPRRTTLGGRGISSWTFLSLHEGTAVISVGQAPIPADSAGATTRFRVVIEERYDGITPGIHQNTGGWIVRAGGRVHRRRQSPAGSSMTWRAASMNRHHLFIPLLAALAVAACKQEPRPYVDNFTYTDTSTYTDTAQAIRAAAGSEFQIRVKSNQSTGYQWVLVDSATLQGVRVVGTDYRVPQELAGRGGAGGAETWTLRAVRPGEHTLSMIYVRPWENTAPRDTTRFRVIIE